MAAVAIWAVGGAPAVADTWTWPVRGEVATGYANRGGPYAGGQHRGIDIAATAGTPVVAAAGGTVRFSGLVGTSGLTVSVRTAGGGLDTSYLHLATASVRAGQAVGPGERIGTAGASGRPSTAVPHVHFGVRDAGTRRYRDPLDFLPPLPGVREVPRGAPVALRGPVRVGPAPEPVRLPWARRAVPRPAPLPWAKRGPAAPLGRAAALSPPGRRLAGGPWSASRIPWAIACGALILAAALAGGGGHGRRGARAVVARLVPSVGGG